MAVGFVLVNTEPGKERLVYDQLQRVPAVKELVPLFGEFELIAKIEAQDFVELGQVVLQNIRSVPGVKQTRTLTGTRF